MSSNNTEVYLNRGLAYYRQGHYQAAITDYDQVISLSPLDFRAYYNRGLARVELKHFTEAIADYHHTLSLISQRHSPILADVYNDRGIAYLMLEDAPGAIADFSVAIRLNGNDDRAYYNRGCACWRQGNYTAAMRDFTQALIAPTNKTWT